jgi:5-methylcytosine-specific restriction endonuclease McrA
MTYPKSDPRKLKPIVKQLDSLVSKIVIARDGKCVLCGSRIDLGTGHWIRRRFYPVRWDLRNCNCLCNICNERDDREPIHYAVWMSSKYGAFDLERLLAIDRHATVKAYQQHVIYRELQEVAKQFGIHAPDLTLTK